MKVVVEITNGRGSRASKEYDAPTVDAALMAAERELRGYPAFSVVDVRVMDYHELRHETSDEW